ncbi:MAG TPA: HAD-IC family P-type ATPase, partial [Longimicrobiales bacterium]|nr:HAD-IC family P-type ATPase [Longimicrobiales bacterium]
MSHARPTRPSPGDDAAPPRGPNTHDHANDHAHPGAGGGAKPAGHATTRADAPRRLDEHPHGHGDAHTGHDPEVFRGRFLLSLLLTIPVVIWSGHVQALLGYRAPAFPGSRWMPAVLGTTVFLYGGLVFLRGARAELRARLPGMMTLIALAILTAFLFSWAAELGVLDAEPVWWELATLVTIMLLGHWIEMRAVARASGALRELARLLPERATRITGTGEELVEVAALRRGDLVLVRPGESVPADGVIEQGETELDESMITGESRPVRRAPGNDVIAGTINGSGSLRVRVTGTGDETKLSGVMRLVAEAQA